MTFRDVRELAIEFGAKLPAFDHTHPIAQAWVDRIAALPIPLETISDANRYAGL